MLRSHSSRVSIRLVVAAGVVVLSILLGVSVARRAKQLSRPHVSSQAKWDDPDRYPPQLLQIPQGIRPVALNFDGPPLPSAGPHSSAQAPSLQGRFGPAAPALRPAIRPAPPAMPNSTGLRLSDAFPPREVEQRHNVAVDPRSQRLPSSYATTEEDALHSVLVERLPPLNGETEEGETSSVVGGNEIPSIELSPHGIAATEVPSIEARELNAPIVDPHEFDAPRNGAPELDAQVKETPLNSLQRQAPPFPQQEVAEMEPPLPNWIEPPPPVDQRPSVPESFFAEESLAEKSPPQHMRPQHTPLENTPPVRMPPERISTQDISPDYARAARADVQQAMAAVSQQANELIQRGFDLANRGALYAARQDMIQALRTMTQALDARDQTRDYSNDLAHALRAIKEAGDFAPSNALEADLDLALIIDGHRTPVLKNADMREATPLAALQQYLTYAQQKLTAAAGNQPSSSFALYGLGRIHAALDAKAKGNDPLGRPKAMAFHQASLLADGRNYLAANELGVLLARYGQLTEARRVLMLSLGIRQNAEVWKNLATVHQQLGEHDLARRANYESQRMAGARPLRRSSAAVTWVPPQQFRR